MKLNELLGIKAHYDKELMHMLHDISGPDSKFSKAGEGAFSQVLVHKSGAIYKFWVKDSMYERFIKLVEKNQSDPHLPKLKSKVKELTAFFKRPADFPDKVKYVKIEWLGSISYHEKLSGTNIYVVDMLRQMSIYAREGKKIEDVIWRIQRDAESDDLPEDAITTMKELYKTIQLLVDEFGKLNDIHSGNLMKRGGVIVITDPVADEDEVKINREMMKKLKHEAEAEFTSGPSRRKTT